MERKAARGEWTSGRGNRPFGYDVTPETHQLVANEIEAPLVPLIFDMYANKNMGAQSIARLLTERGHRTRLGKPWGSKTVLGVLRNRVYVGEIFFRGKHHSAKHDPLIDSATFDRAARILDQRGDDFTKRQSTGIDYLLTGLLICSHCSKHFLGTAARGNRYRYRYYTCYSRNRYGNDVCSADRLPAEGLESAVVKALIDTFSKTYLFDEAVETVAKQSDGLRSQQRAELASVGSELRKTESGIERYLLAFEEGKLPESTCGERLRVLGEKAANLRQRREDLQLAVDAETLQAPSAEQLRAVRERVAQTLENADDPARKRLLQELVYEIRIDNRGCITPTFRVPDPAPNPQHTKVREMGGLAVPTGHNTNHEVLVSGPTIQLKRRGEPKKASSLSTPRANTFAIGNRRYRATRQ
jgi:site-specific DNA recombinase